MKRYIIGIDLGTTNCTLSYCDCEEKRITSFPIPQMTKQGIEEAPYSLPSFIFFPLEDDGKLVGTYARDRGAELPGRLISSAKSWLGSELINRREKFLPLDASEDIEKQSPIDALASLLSHLKVSWDEKFEDKFAEQTVLITVPASFDPGARQLVEESASMAGYPEVILLEEPQAAFYSWLYQQGENWRQKLSVKDRVLVIDIGGGTTDFSLIEVAEEGGNLSLNRLAVGEHLLLGGDNIDLALAYKCMQELPELDSVRLRELVMRCREAKEVLLGLNPPEKITITIKGKGTKLIGGSLKCELTKESVLATVLDGFFPLVSLNEAILSEKKSGMRQVGLPYVQDARISAHIAKFVSQNGLPTKILFNGGTLKSEAIKKRVIELLNEWTQNQISVLEDADLDFAVSKGAAYYGLSRVGGAIRIKAGTSRTYFIGIEEAMPAVPGFTPALKALCVVPFGMEEGDEIEIKEKEFTLLLGENATFRFFSSSTRKDEPGTFMSNSKELQELSPIEAILEKLPGDGTVAKVRLKSKVTELGALQLWCVGENDRKWKLEFNIR